MIRQGYGHEYTYQLPYKRQAEFKEAEKCQSGSTGCAWDSASCDGPEDREAQDGVTTLAIAEALKRVKTK